MLIISGACLFRKKFIPTSNKTKKIYNIISGGENMKKSIFLSLLIVSYPIMGSTSNLFGQVFAERSCMKSSQLFVSTAENELLYQLMVPVNGTFALKLKDGNYALLAANRDGCESRKINFSVAGKEIKKIKLRLEKKSLKK